MNPIDDISCKESKECKEYQTKSDGQKVAESGIRYCTVRESLEDSLKEVKEIREGKRQGMTLDDLFDNIDKWCDEEDA